jgi:hypothetical protein
MIPTRTQCEHCVAEPFYCKGCYDAAESQRRRLAGQRIILIATFVIFLAFLVATRV